MRHPRFRRPTIEHKSPVEFHIIPYFTDIVKVDSDLFRFIVPVHMMLKYICVNIDKLSVESLLLNGGVQSISRKLAIGELVKLGMNEMEFDIPVDKVDMIIINFDDRELASQVASGITISICATK